MSDKSECNAKLHTNTGCVIVDKNAITHVICNGAVCTAFHALGSFKTIYGINEVSQKLGTQFIKVNKTTLINRNEIVGINKTTLPTTLNLKSIKRTIDCTKTAVSEIELILGIEARSIRPDQQDRFDWIYRYVNENGVLSKLDNDLIAFYIKEFNLKATRHPNCEKLLKCATLERDLSIMTKKSLITRRVKPTNYNLVLEGYPFKETYYEITKNG